MLKTILAAAVLTSALALAPLASSAQPVGRGEMAPPRPHRHDDGGRYRHHRHDDRHHHHPRYDDRGRN